MAKDPLSQEKMDHLLGQAEDVFDEKAGTISEFADMGEDLNLSGSDNLEDIVKENSESAGLSSKNKSVEVDLDPGEEGNLKVGDIVNLKSQPGQVNMLEVTLPSLETKIGAKEEMEPNLNLLMDVQMTLTVELGRTKMFVKEILGLGEGSIIELDKLAGEPVDLLVNGKLVAKGEVVVIDENFGVRVTDIVSSAKRIQMENKDSG